jgi:hypothetical protein
LEFRRQRPRQHIAGLPRIHRDPDAVLQDVRQLDHGEGLPLPYQLLWAYRRPLEIQLSALIPVLQQAQSAYVASGRRPGFWSMWSPVKDISASRLVRRRTEVPNRLQDVLPDGTAIFEKIPVMAQRLDLRGFRSLPKVVVDAEGEAEDQREAIQCLGIIHHPALSRAQSPRIYS